MLADRALFALTLTFFVFFSGCAEKEKIEEIDFSDTVQTREGHELRPGEINICVGSMITPEAGFGYYKKLLRYIGKGLDMRVNFIERRSYAEVNALLKARGADVAFVCSGTYVAGHDDFGLELLVAPQVGGKVVYYSYIIVEATSPIERFEDLKGGSFAFTDPMSNTGRLVPEFMLKKLGEKPETFFKEYSYTYSHDASIRTVAKGIVDGAAVDSLIWDYLNRKEPDLTATTRIIRMSEPYGIPPVVVRQGLDEDIRGRLKLLLLKMHESEHGKEILGGMFIEKFVEIDDSMYDSIRKIKMLLDV